MELIPALLWLAYGAAWGVVGYLFGRWLDKRNDDFEIRVGQALDRAVSRR